MRLFHHSDASVTYIHCCKPLKVLVIYCKHLKHACWHVQLAGQGEAPLSRLSEKLTRPGSASETQR